jgi:predicted transcriptional regulator
MLTKIFQNLGLTDKEAKVYLASLEIGTNPVSEIGKKSKINRVTTYDILEKLIKKGLVNYIVRRNIKYFSATDPELIATEYKRRAEELYVALPELKKLHGETSVHKVQYFEGLEGIKRVYEDSLKSINPDKESENGEAAAAGGRFESTILNFANAKEIRSIWPTYENDYTKKRIEKGIVLKNIAPDEEFGRIIQAQDKDNFSETRLIPKEKFSFTNEIIIYNNKVAIISLAAADPLAILIENRDIAQSQRTIFNLIWDFTLFKETAFPMAKPSTPIILSTPATNFNGEMTIRKVGGIKDKKVESPESQTSLF